MEFTTRDVDNDLQSYGNCATTRGYGGGNWYRACTQQNMNAKFGEDGEEGAEFMSWWHFDNNWMALQKMRWMLREV